LLKAGKQSDGVIGQLCFGLAVFVKGR